MQKLSSKLVTVIILLCVLCCCVFAVGETTKYRRLPVKQYVDKMKAAWLGQMAGVGWGAPTEFRFRNKVVPEVNVPKWTPETINQFAQDDIYVEMTFLRTLELYGLDASAKQAGIDFANSGYGLWHANRIGRDNLRGSIAPPDSGHPKFSSHADDIDYQIEADFSGIIAPAMPNMTIKLGEKFGSLMNYGDGLYGGQFIGGMYCEAFFESNPEKIVEAGLKCIPPQSQYAECIRDVLSWYKQNTDDWQKTWQLIYGKYQLNPDYRKFSCDTNDDLDIDAKINGAYVVTGLLYGKGNIEKTIEIAMRCGQDSDCNPANAGGVLFTTIGYEKLPSQYKTALDSNGIFSYTSYNFSKLVNVCEKLAREAVIKEGGKIEKGLFSKNEVFIIPVKEPVPSEFVQCWAPGPIANSRYNGEELKKIIGFSSSKIAKQLESFAPGWNISKYGFTDIHPGLVHEYNGKKNVFITHPLGPNINCRLYKKIKVPADKKTVLRLTVSHHKKGNWILIVKADCEELLSKPVDSSTAKNGWLDVEVDLSKYAGKEIELSLMNKPIGWSYESFEVGYWAKIEVISQDKP